METITVTCPVCGKTEQIEDTPEAIHNQKCAACGVRMMEKRPPGDTDHYAKVA